MKKVTSCIKTKNGMQILCANGKELPGIAYMTYLTEKNRYSDFARAGYSLFSLPVMFGDRWISETSHLPPFKQGIFTTEPPSFHLFDRDVREILEACPEAMIFPRLNVSVTRAWEEAHPDELNDGGTSVFPETRRASFSSDAWACEVKRMLTLFIAHVESSDYSEHVLGYQIAGGQTEEWMAFDQNGSQGVRSREKYARYLSESKRDDSEEEYYAFLSRMTANRICEFAAHVKELTEHRLVVGAFYGYTMELCSRGMTHHALHRVLEDKNVDFICSPVSYGLLRATGRDHPNMLPLNSLKLWGKLYFAENDTRTHLTRPLNDMPAYNLPIWQGPDRESAINNIKMHFARALTHGHAMWWFDMWGGWFADPYLMSLMEKMRRILEEAMEKDGSSAARFAVFVDEKSVFKSAGAGEYTRVCYKLREVLGACGAPYDIYLAEDHERVVGRYRGEIFLVPHETPLSLAAEASARERGIPTLKITDAQSNVTTEELRSFLRSAGVHLYSESDAVIYATESYLFLHTAHGGETKLSLPEGISLCDAFTGEACSPDVVADAGHSYLFELI